MKAALGLAVAVILAMPTTGYALSQGGKPETAAGANGAYGLNAEPSNTPSTRSEPASMQGITVTSQFKQGSNMWNQVLAFDVKIDQSASIKSGSTLTLTFSNPNSVDWKNIQPNGDERYGKWSYDAQKGTATLTFALDISQANINLIINFHPIGNNSKNNKVSATFNGQDIELKGANQYDFEMPQDPGYGDNRMVPGWGSYSVAGLGDNYIGDIQGKHYYMPGSTSMDFNIVVDPGYLSKPDQEKSRTITLSTSGDSSSISPDDVMLSEDGGWPNNSKHYVPLAKHGWTTRQIDPQTLEVIIPDGFQMSWYILGIKVQVRDATAAGKLTMVYKSNLIQKQEKYLEGCFQNLDNLGFIPQLNAGPDRALKQGETMNLTQWLLDPVTATDVEDGDLSGKVVVDQASQKALMDRLSEQKNGPVKVKFSVKDSDGNSRTAEYTVTVYSDVLVHYTDENGEKIKDDAVLSGKVGTDFTVDRSDVTKGDSHYYFLSSQPDVAKGTYGSDGQPTDITLTYKKDLTSLTAEDYAMYVGDPEPTADSFKAKATDRDGKPVATSVDLSKADLSKPGTYQVTIKTADGRETQAKLTVKADQRSLTAEDYAMYVGDPEPTADSFKAKATDRDGKPVATSVDLSKADLSKPGTYQVTIKTADGRETQAKLTVKADQRSLTAEDYAMYVGDPEPTADSFKAKATDRDGKPVATSVDLSKADLSKPGTYQVTIKTADGRETQAKLTVKADQRSLTAEDYAMYVGDPEPTADSFKAKATDRDGKPVATSVDLSKADLSKPGTYQVTIKTADGRETQAKLTVKADQRSLTAEDYAMYVGDPEPTADSFKAKATDRDGKPVATSVDLSKADLSKPGTYQVTIKTADGRETQAKLTVKAKPASNGSSSHTVNNQDGDKDPADLSSTGANSAWPIAAAAIALAAGVILLLVAIRRRGANKH